MSSSPTFNADVVACLDVGSPKRGNVGWAVVVNTGSITGCDLTEFVSELAGHVDRGHTVALGFECPLYVPKRPDVFAMTAPRLGEGSLNWCGGPGSSVLATGLVQVNWVLAALRARFKEITATTRWREFSGREHPLFIWEAFITRQEGVSVELGASETTQHERDALCGAVAFQRLCKSRDSLPSDLQDEPAISLIGLQLLECGLNTNVQLLSETCTVLKVKKPDRHR